MKKKLIITFWMVCCAFADPITEIPHSRGPNSLPPSHLNSISSNQDSSKQNLVPSQFTLHDATNSSSHVVLQPLQTSIGGQQQNAFFTHLQAQPLTLEPQQQNNAYVLTANPNQANGKPVSGPQAQTPIIMQYVPQSGQGQNGFQYIQLVATRPIMYTYPQYVSQPLPQQSVLPNIPQSSANTLTHPSFGTGQHQFQTQPQTFPSYQQPVSSPLVGSYSSPAPQYFGPPSRFQFLNTSPDLTLNTNEYIPAQPEGGFRAIKPQSRS